MTAAQKALGDKAQALGKAATPKRSARCYATVASGAFVNDGHAAYRRVIDATRARIRLLEGQGTEKDHEGQASYEAIAARRALTQEKLAALDAALAPGRTLSDKERRSLCGKIKDHKDPVKAQCAKVGGWLSLLKVQNELVDKREKKAVTAADRADPKVLAHLKDALALADAILAQPGDRGRLVTAAAKRIGQRLRELAGENPNPNYADLQKALAAAQKVRDKKLSVFDKRLGACAKKKGSARTHCEESVTARRDALNATPVEASGNFEQHMTSEKHSYGLAFDIDDPHKTRAPCAKGVAGPCRIPQAAVNIFESGGEFRWLSHDASHIEAIVPACP